MKGPEAGWVSLAAVVATVVAAAVLVVSWRTHNSSFDRTPARRPVMVGHRLVDPADGRIVDALPGGPHFRNFSEPVRGQSGWFRYNGLLVDVDRPLRFQRSGLAERHGFLEFLDEDGKSKWNHDRPSVRPPGWAASHDVVAIATRTGLIGLDKASGTQRWSHDENSSRLAAAHGNVVVFQRPGGAHEIVAYRFSDGAEQWRRGFPEAEDPWSFLTTQSLLFARQCETRRDPAWTRVLTTDGVLRFLLDGECVLAAVELSAEGDLIVVTGKRTARLTRKGGTVWEVPSSAEVPVTGSASMVIEDGDYLIVGRYRPYADSGLILERIEVTDGTLSWTSASARLSVMHSKYWHQAYLELRDSEFIVVSQAESGDFVERRRTSDGHLLARWRSDGREGGGFYDDRDGIGAVLQATE